MLHMPQTKITRAGRSVLTIFLSLLLLMGLLPPVTAAADEEFLSAEVVSKIYIRTNTNPAVYMTVSNITASTGTTGCVLASYVLLDADGEPASGQFADVNYTFQATVNVASGYMLDSTTVAFLNGDPAEISVDPSGLSAVVTKTIVPAYWAPTVITQPAGVSIEEGGTAKFTASAIYISGNEAISWYFSSPDGKERLKYADAADRFEGLSLSPEHHELVQLSNIPGALNGWKIFCVFTGANGCKTETVAAAIKVKDVTPTPTPTPEATPTPTPTPEPEASGSETEAEAEVTDDLPEETHAHSFSADWSYSAQEHWHTCDCGERSDQAAHSFQWFVTQAATARTPGTEKGTCTVCGYTTTRETEPTGGLDLAALPVVPVLLVLAAIILIVIICQAVSQSRRRHRRRGRRHTH